MSQRFVFTCDLCGSEAELPRKESWLVVNVTGGKISRTWDICSECVPRLQLPMRVEERA